MKFPVSVLVGLLLCLLLPIDVESGPLLLMTCYAACKATLAGCVAATVGCTAGLAAIGCTTAYYACTAAAAAPTP